MSLFIRALIAREGPTHVTSSKPEVTEGSGGDGGKFLGERIVQKSLK